MVNFYKSFHGVKMLNAEEYEYYKAHLSLEELGTEGQLKLKNAKVLIVGLGGLGSPCALYLAAAGVGSLGLVDFDIVERSNLQRQIIHSNIEVGYPKVISAKKRLTEMNPHIDLKIYDKRITEENVLKIIEDYDYIVDGSDNFETKYLLGDACYFSKKILVTASVSQFDGQITVFAPGDFPCYRCLYPNPPHVQMKNCAQQGAYSIAPAILGTMQANEILKSILKIGEPLTSKVMLYNSLNNSLKSIKLNKDSNCPMCGKKPSITKVQKISSPEEICHTIDSIKVMELKNWQEKGKEFILLDVRDPFEVELANIGGVNIPLKDLDKSLDKIADFKNKDVVVHCHHGIRSMDACRILKDNKFEKVKNLYGGIDQWSINVDPGTPRY